MAWGARLVAAAMLIAACSPRSATGPAVVAWDRDACERCNMTIGDRRFAAQVRSPRDHRVHAFDDLGCALLWIDEQSWREAGPQEIWVRDLGGHEWLDARRAGYVEVENSPMDYGFGAVDPAAGGDLGLAEVQQRIRERERERRSLDR